MFAQLPVGTPEQLNTFWFFVGIILAFIVAGSAIIAGALGLKQLFSRAPKDNQFVTYHDLAEFKTALSACATKEELAKVQTSLASCATKEELQRGTTAIDKLAEETKGRYHQLRNDFSPSFAQVAAMAVRQEEMQKRFDMLCDQSMNTANAITELSAKINALCGQGFPSVSEASGKRRKPT